MATVLLNFDLTHNNLLTIYNLATVDSNAKVVINIVANTDQSVEERY
jgi:hypothetical protein